MNDGSTQSEVENLREQVKGLTHVAQRDHGEALRLAEANATLTAEVERLQVEVAGLERVSKEFWESQGKRHPLIDAAEARGREAGREEMAAKVRAALSSIVGNPEPESIRAGMLRLGNLVAPAPKGPEPDDIDALADLDTAGLVPTLGPARRTAPAPRPTPEPPAAPLDAVRRKVGERVEFTACGEVEEIGEDEHEGEVLVMFDPETSGIWIPVEDARTPAAAPHGAGPGERKPRRCLEAAAHNFVRACDAADDCVGEGAETSWVVEAREELHAAARALAPSAPQGDPELLTWLNERATSADNTAVCMDDEGDDASWFRGRAKAFRDVITYLAALARGLRRAVSLPHGEPPAPDRERPRLSESAVARFEEGPQTFEPPCPKCDEPQALGTEFVERTGPLEPAVEHWTPEHLHHEAVKRGAIPLDAAAIMHGRDEPGEVE